MYLFCYAQERQLLVQEQEVVLDLIKSTPKEHLSKIIEALDYNNRKLYSQLKENCKDKKTDFVALVYQTIKSLYQNKIPIDKRKQYLVYCANLDILWESEENVVLDLIETTPDDDLDALFTFMRKNKLYTNFAHSIDNIFGKPNYDAFVNLVKKKWSDCYPNKKDGEFILETDQAFLKWYEKEWNLHRALFHFDVTIGADAAMGFTGSRVAVSFGCGIDSHGNIALFGNANIFAYIFNKGVQYNKITELRTKSIDDALSDYKNWNFISGVNAYAGISINYDYFASDVSALFGIGKTTSYSITYKGLDFSFLINCDGNDNFIGFGYGVGVSIGKDVFPVQRVSELNRGLIVHASELLNLKCTLDEKQKTNLASLDIENGFLVIRSWIGKIKTNLQADWGDKNHTYIVTLNSNIPSNK